MKAMATLALVLLVLPAIAAAGAEPFSLDHLARLRTVMAADISPDGKQIAYLLSVPRRPFVEDDGPAWTELHVVDIDGHSRPYVSGQVNVAAIAWKPDGSGIAFLAKRGDDKHKSVYFIPLAGGEARKLIEHDTDIVDYSWSPDGRKLAFTAEDKEADDKKEIQDKGFNQDVYEEQWKNHRVWVGTLAARDAWEDGARPKPERFELPGDASGVQWSPRGKYLAVAVAPTPSIDDMYMKRKVHVIAADDGKPVGVIDNPGKLGVYRFSPDEAQVALIAGADIHDPNAGRLMVAPVAGGTPLDILPELTDGDVTDIAWRVGDEIVYLADRGVTSSVAAVDSTGKQQRTIVPFGKYAMMGLSVAEAGNRGAVLVHSAAHPFEVFTMAQGDTEPRRLTHTNPWLEKVALARQEVVKFKARDGLDLEGLLIRPLDEKPGQRYPLVLIVHGGPEAHFQDGWISRYSEPGQLLAAQGFAVFYPNYRGSTGRGVEFSKKGQADYAGKEFDDLIDAVDHLVAQGLVDKDKVGVTGGSYGGYASAWCATRHTDRFAASVMFVGISDLVSKFGTTDIPNELYLVHARKLPWEDWKFFAERSPLSYAEQARTPLLIMHGKEDPRVHPSQSLELYRYLKVLGKVPVRLVLYQGEGHGNRKAAARQDYAMRLLEWMKHYLQGPGGDPPAPQLDYAALKPKDQDKKDEGDRAGAGEKKSAAPK